MSMLVHRGQGHVEVRVSYRDVSKNVVSPLYSENMLYLDVWSCIFFIFIYEFSYLHMKKEEFSKLSFTVFEQTNRL